MRRVIAAAALAASVAGAVTACASSGPDAGACKAAMTADFNAGASGSTTPASKPAACDGLSSKQLGQIADQVVSGALATLMPSAPPSANAGPANPVAIVKQAGAVTSAKLGQTDVWGDRYADGDLPGGESVDVYTYADRAAQAEGEVRNQPTDAMAVISGHLFDVLVYSIGTEDGGNSFPVPVETIAERVGGNVLGG